MKTLRLSLALSLENEFEDVQFLALNAKSRFKLEHLFQHSVIGKKSYVRFMKNIFSYLFSKKSTLVLSFTTEANIFTCLMCFIFKKKCICVFTGLGSIFISKSIKNTFVLFVAAPIMRSAYLIIVQNKQDAVYLSNLWKIDPSRIKIVNGSGINIDQKINAAKVHDDAPKSFVVIARLIKEKGILEFLNAIEILQDDNLVDKNKIGFTIFGSYDKNNPSCLSKDKLEERCASLGVDLIEFSPSILLSILRSHTHFVLPSYREGTSKALLEACLSNLFPIVADVPGCNNVVQHNYSGLLFDPKDAVALSQAILQACRLPNQVTQHMANKARANVIRNFSKKVINDKMLEIISDGMSA